MGDPWEHNPATLGPGEVGQVREVTGIDRSIPTCGQPLDQ